MPPVLKLLTVVLTATGSMLLAADTTETVTFSVTLDPGQDVGQSFGSVFEARDAAGRVVAGAGFQDVYNTRFRNSRHTLQFFVRPKTGADRFAIERLPHPDLDCGIYLFDMDGRIYAWTSVNGNSVRRWDAEAGEWKAELPAGVRRLGSGDGVMRVGSGRLVFSDSAAWFNDQQILTPPDVGGYRNFYYAQGHLCFYHRQAGDNGFTHLYACPWTADDPQPIDLTKAVKYDTPFDRETPFAWGQWEQQIVTVSNMGGIYVFEDGRWRMTLAPDPKTSYQVYSALHWHDRVLLAQYPTGNVFEYQGQEATRLQNWPPVLPGVATSARECQTLSIYRGDLMAGVWPWAEVWRRDRDAGKWHSQGRLFSHPEITSEDQHPYEPESRELGMVLNHWGQRVTGMIPSGDSLYLSTSSKGTVAWKDEYKFLTDAQRREYGSVLRLRMAGNLAVVRPWKDEPAQLTFTVSPDQLTIRQDGRLLGSAALPDDFDADLTDLDVVWGEGAFGPLRGTLSDQQPAR